MVVEEAVMTATLRNLTDMNYGLAAFCKGCDRYTQFDVAQLVERYGPDMELPTIGHRAKCTACGHKGAAIQVQAVIWPTICHDEVLT